MFVLKISRSSLNMGHIGSETRSLGQMKENLVNTKEVAFRIIVLDVFCIAVHCIIKVSDPGPSWPFCLPYIKGAV